MNIMEDVGFQLWDPASVDRSNAPNLASQPGLLALKQLQE